MSDYTRAEGYLYYTYSVPLPSSSTDKHYYYNYYYRIERGKFSTELYWPETDPPLPECSLIPGYAYNAGGSMQAWHKASGYGDRSMFAGQSGTPRIDFNNDYTSTQLYISDVQIAPAEDIIYRYNQEFGTSITVSDINKEFCDCWVESAKGSIIHIYNPLTKQIAFGANKKVNRSDTAYTRAQLEALKNVHNSSWSTTGYSNSDLKRGDVCYIDCTISDENNKKARFFVVINSVIVTSNSSSILTDNLNYYTEDEDGYNLETDILCNDIIIDPTVNKITFNKENGTIVCKKLVKTQTY